MINLNKAVNENKEEAIKKLKELGCSIIFNTSGDDAEWYPNGEEPYILIDKGDGEIADLMVTKVRLSDDYGIEVYIPSIKEWCPISWALGYTENNVYECIVGGSSFLPLSGAFEDTKNFMEMVYDRSVEVKNSCEDYLKVMLEKEDKKKISFIDGDGDPYFGDVLYVEYDGGSHPEYAANPFSQVRAIYLNEKGKLVVDIEDCSDYEFDRLTWEDAYSVASYAYDLYKEWEIGEK